MTSKLVVVRWFGKGVLACGGWVFLVAALVGVMGMTASGWAAPVRLRVEQRVNPLGMDVRRPRFSWQSDATERGWTQTGYQILVATSEGLLRAGKADVWDSGRVASGESLQVGYGGPALQSRQRYYWSVEVWDGQGRTARSSEVAWWEMGLLEAADWKAGWIRRSDPAEEQELKQVRWIGLPESVAAEHEQAEFGYKLHLERKPFAAALHGVSTGTFTVRVNGVVTGHKREWGAFDREEILDELKYGPGAAGDNEIAVTVAAPKIRGEKMPSAALLAVVLRVEEADGRSAGAIRRVVSDGTWQVRRVEDAGRGEWSAAKDVGGLQELPAAMGPDHLAREAAPDRVVTEASLLRRDFTAGKAVVSARLYVTALGSYRAFLNGQVVGESVLTPDFTDYRKRVLYQTYDVTGMVKPGANTLGAMLGGGWHGSPLLWSGTRKFAGPDLLRAQLEMTLADGTRQTVVSDGGWSTARAPIVSSEIYAGEAYDARLEQAGWSAPGFAGKRGWSTAVVEQPAAGVQVTAQLDLPVHRTETIKPVGVTAVGSGGVVVFDMGQNMVGAVRLHVRGPRGSMVRMQFAERLNPDGTVYTENLRNADATDRYTLRGDGDEVWTPAFTFHGFRYVQVSGYPGEATVGSLEGEVWNSLEAAPAFRLTTSNDLLNRMYALGIWGQRGNFVSIPTDCPQRDERLGWMGDAGVFWRTGSYNFDIGSFSHKFMQDVVDAQTAGGAFSDVSPDLLGITDTAPGSPGWGDAGVLVPHAAWMQYGDRGLLEQNWGAMEKWMEYILRTNPNYLRRHSLGNNYADWLAPDQNTPKDLVATAYWAIMARQMEEMATALGRGADATKYREVYEKIAAAYRSAYVKADGSVAGDTQTAYLLTLYAGLAPQELEAGLTARLVKDIEAHQNHLTTGFLGTPFLLFVLDHEGRSDVAYRLLLNDTYPSWGYMVKKGASTWWERWNGDTGDPGMNSYNHYAFGSVMAWVYRRVAGIDTDGSAPGFHHLVIRPQVEAGLSHVRAEYDSAYGLVVTEWTRGEDGTLRLSVRTPANTSATVYLPGSATSVVTEDGKPLAGQYDKGAWVTTIGSGSYEFAVGK